MTASALGQKRPGEIHAPTISRASAPTRGFRLLPARLVASAWLLALVPMGLLQLTHADLHEHNELPPLLHWLRDAALAVPFAAAAVVIAALVVAWIRPDAQTGRGALLAPVLWAVVAAIGFAVLSIPGNELHSFLFGAEEEVGVSLFDDLIADGILALQGSLVVIVPVALLLGVPWRGRLRDQHATRGVPAAGSAR